MISVNSARDGFGIQVARCGGRRRPRILSIGVECGVRGYAYHPPLFGAGGTVLPTFQTRMAQFLMESR